jgi:hypothetical protein
MFMKFGISLPSFPSLVMKKYIGEHHARAGRFHGNGSGAQQAHYAGI